MTEQETERSRVMKIILDEIERWKINEHSQNQDELVSCASAIGALSNVFCAVAGWESSITVEVDGVVRGSYKNAHAMALHFSEILKSHDAMKKELTEIRGTAITPSEISPY